MRSLDIAFGLTLATPSGGRSPPFTRGRSAPLPKLRACRSCRRFRDRAAHANAAAAVADVRLSANRSPRRRQSFFGHERRLLDAVGVSWASLVRRGQACPPGRSDAPWRQDAKIDAALLSSSRTASPKTLAPLGSSNDSTSELSLLRACACPPATTLAPDSESWQPLR